MRAFDFLRLGRGLGHTLLLMLLAIFLVGALLIRMIMRVTFYIALDCGRWSE
jgi:hypothetical protein